MKILCRLFLIYSAFSTSGGWASSTNRIQFEYQSGNLSVHTDVLVNSDTRRKVLQSVLTRGFIGELKGIEEEEITAYSNARYELLAGAIERMKGQASSTLEFQPVDLPTIPEISSVGEIANTQYGSESHPLINLEQRIQSCAKELSEASSEESYDCLLTMKQFLRERLERQPESSVLKYLSAALENEFSKLFHDGVLANSALRFQTPKSEVAGRGLRHLTNLCLLRSSCPRKDLVVALILLDHFGVDLNPKTYRRLLSLTNGEEGWFSALARALGESELFRKFKEELREVTSDERAAAIDWNGWKNIQRSGLDEEYRRTMNETLTKLLEAQ